MKVSVVTPNYNGLKFLNSYFETLLIQSRFIEEIIIIDNASTDGSVEFIEEHVFLYANSLSSITVAQNNNYFADINGISDFESMPSEFEDGVEELETGEPVEFIETEIKEE